MIRKPAPKDLRLAHVMRLARALPEVRYVLAGRHATFEVQGQVFAYYLNDHLGDGVIGVCCKLPPGENDSLASARPEHYYRPERLAPEGWLGIRLDRPKVNWDEVASRIAVSYRQVAPARLALLADAEDTRARKR